MVRPQHGPFHSRVLDFLFDARSPATQVMPGSFSPFCGLRARARAGTPAWESSRRPSLPINPVPPVTRIINDPFSWRKDNLPFQFRFVHLSIYLRRLVERKGLTV